MNQGGNRADMPKWFVLQATDSITACPVLEARFVVDDLAALRNALGDVVDRRDPHLEWSYPLDREHLRAIERSFGVSISEEGRDVTLVPWHSTREAPYLIHTGFELSLMLEGRKPFAKFADAYPDEWFDELVGKFDRFVEDGRLIRRIVTRPFDELAHLPGRPVMESIREVYFALPGEEWRIDAYLLLVQVGTKAGWNDALERYEGSLLGYEDWQNDWWIDQLRSRREIEPSQ
jgi:hypothetical protein